MDAPCYHHTQYTRVETKGIENEVGRGTDDLSPYSIRMAMASRTLAIPIRELSLRKLGKPSSQPANEPNSGSMRSCYSGHGGGGSLPVAAAVVREIVGTSPRQSVVKGRKRVLPYRVRE